METDKDEIFLGQDLTIRIAEPDANFDSRSMERLPFTIISITTNKFDEESLDRVLDKTGIRTTQPSLMETGFNTGVFEVTLESINDSLVTRGHDIRIVYIDNTPSGGSSPTRIETVVHVGKASISVTFDKNEYSQFDTVELTVVAQMFNVNRDKIDTLNTPSGGSIVVIAPSGQKYFPPMIESGMNTGVFIGKIKLTSDPDYKEGDLVVKSGDRIRVSAAIIPGIEAGDSASITTRLGSISFDRSDYEIGDTVNLIVIDPDENKDSDVIDIVQVRVWSGTDPNGISLTLYEMGLFSGTFEGKFTLGVTNQTLQVSENDIMFAKYNDRTVQSLTQPASKDLFVSARIGAMLHTDVLISEPSLYDQDGNELTNIRTGSIVAVQSSLTNSLAEKQPFVYITHVKDADGFTVQLSFVKGSFEPFQSLRVAQSWIPDLAGKYTVEVLVWDSIEQPSPLSPIKKFTATVKE
ncbi:MAG: hypothetical protein ACRD38_07240 [Nitrososphaerales archaeon]